MEINKTEIDNCDTCSEIKELLPLLIDNILSADEEEKVMRHLLSCPECARARDELQEIKALLSSFETLPVPPEFDLRLKNALRRENTPRPFKYRWKSISAVAAAVFIMVLSYNFINDNMLAPETNEEAVMSMKSAEFGNQAAEESSAAPDAQIASDATVESAGLADRSNLDMYYQLISEKFQDYNYTVISDAPEIGEIKLMILSDKNGVEINKEFTIQYADGQISSTDNWLDIDLN